jgi:hypothetical protein
MRASKRDQYNWENVAALMPMAARDLEGVLCSARKKMFQCVGILRVADAVAEQDHSVFEISGLPRVHEVVSGSQGEYVAGFGGGFLLGWMAVRSGPDWGRQQGKTNCQQGLHAKAGPQLFTVLMFVTSYSTGKQAERQQPLAKVGSISEKTVLRQLSATACVGGGWVLCQPKTTRPTKEGSPPGIPRPDDLLKKNAFAHRSPTRFPNRLPEGDPY